MKIFGMITLLTVLASFGASAGEKVSSAKVSAIDPVIAEKFEAAIRSQRAGMVSIFSENGSSLELNYNETFGRYESKIYNKKTSTRETVLKIDGDTIYTLTEDYDNGNAKPTSREVKMESISQKIKDISEPLPLGTKVLVRGDLMTMKFSFPYTIDLSMDTGKTITQAGNIKSTMNINLNDIRCSQATNSEDSSNLNQNGVVMNLQTMTSRSTKTCGASLSKAQLQKIYLKNIPLCDQTSGDDDADVNCQTEADLSYLVK